MVEAGDGTAQPTWKFTQCFGDKGDVEDITEADIISTVEFDQTGNYLATGDKGGRVVLFERNETKKTCEYKFHTEFQSHEPEFDYLKSLEIEEKINKIKWCRRQNASHYLLSTNDKTIKLWKVFEVVEGGCGKQSVARADACWRWRCQWRRSSQISKPLPKCC